MVAKRDKIEQTYDEEVVLEILRALRSIKYGSIQLIVQDGKLIQIDKTEKVRFPRPATS